MNPAIVPVLSDSLVDHIRQHLEDAERAAGTYTDDPAGWHHKHRAEMEQLAERLAHELGARITDKWDSTRVRLAGVTASSTGGISAAITNWIAAAERRLAA